MSLQRAIVWMIVVAVGLPTAMCVLFALSRLLQAMQDVAGADVLARVNLALFVLWAVDLVVLLIVSAINSLNLRPPGGTDIEP